MCPVCAFLTPYLSRVLLWQSGVGIDEGTAEEALALFGESKQILLGIMSSVGSGSVSSSSCYLFLCRFVSRSSFVQNSFLFLQPVVVERFWSAFLLYCVIRLCTGREKRDSDDGRLKLSQILEAAKLKLGFFVLSIEKNMILAFSAPLKISI